jgi:hypothetical protein
MAQILRWSKNVCASPAPAIAIATGAVFFPFARIDYDRHHDGWVLESAVAVHSGMRVHGDVFNNWGPVNSWIQALFMHLPISAGLAVRVVTLLSICLTVFFMADLGRRRPKGSPVSQQAGVMAAISWIILSDVWAAGPMRPWPVFTTNLLVVLSAYFALRSWYAFERSCTFSARALMFGAGLTLGLALFTRVASGIILIIAFGVCGIVVLLTRATRKSLLLWSIEGALISVTLVLFTMWSGGYLTDFYENTVVFPLSYFGANPLMTISFLGKILPVYGPPVLIGVLSLLFMRTNAALTDRTRSAVSLVSGLLILGTIYVLPATLNSMDQAGAGYFSYGRPLSFFLTCAIAAVLGTFAWVAKVTFTEGCRSTALCAWLIMAIFATAMFGEIPPDYTVRHIWWSLPMGLILLFSVIPRLSGSGRIRDNPLLTPLVLIAAYSAYFAVLNLSIIRVEAPADSVASGMLVPPAVRREIAEDVNLLERSLGSKKAVYFTLSTDLAVVRGTFSSRDAFFSCYGAPSDLSSRLSTTSTVVLARGLQECPNVNEQVLLSHGFVQFDANDRVVVFMRK